MPVSGPGALRSQRQSNTPWHRLDMVLVGSVAALVGVGGLLVYSATHVKLHEAGLDPATYIKKQVIFLAIGLVVMAITVSVDYHVIRDFVPVLYGGGLLVLALVLSPIGSRVRGAQAWFQVAGIQFEPSEIVKVIVIVAAAAYAASHRGRLTAGALIRLLLLFGLPSGLVYLQPDLGSALVFGAIMLAMVSVAGARGRDLMVLVFGLAFATVAVFQLGVVKQYQRDRLTAFLDPGANGQQSAYNLRESMIAIGSGGVRGKGIFRGTQTNLSFVPEQRTDFIFTVAGEEMGLLGAGTVIGLFGVVVWRLWRAALLAKDLEGTLICVGVLALFMFQAFENIGMTMGIMPITGIPLPFLSYGGSALIAYLAAVGLALNVHMRRFS